MTKCVWKRVGNTFVPYSTEAREVLAAIKDGAECVGDIHGARNPQQLRLYWALCAATADATTGDKDGVDEYLRSTLMPRDEYMDPFGRRILQTRSIAPAAMKQDVFDAFFKRCIEEIVTLVGCSRADLRQRVFDLIDGDIKRKYGDLLR